MLFNTGRLQAGEPGKPGVQFSQILKAWKLPAHVQEQKMNEPAKEKRENLLYHCLFVLPGPWMDGMTPISSQISSA
jgi:hypothetical protein